MPLKVGTAPSCKAAPANNLSGPEKLLEVWFAPSADALPPPARPTGLKSVTQAKWTEMLDLVHCKILSVIESEDADAYLLSESSLFVFPHKLVLKTCGITTLLSGLPAIHEIAALDAGFPHTPANPPAMRAAAATPYRVFYSRKNFLHPEQQRGPHRSWRDEVRALDRLFQRGSAYMIGKMNGEHWYLYITEPDVQLTPPATPEHEKVDVDTTETKTLNLPESVNGLNLDGRPADAAEDETLEILMTDLDEDNAKQFYLDHASSVAEGRHMQKFRAARKESRNALGSIDEGVLSEVKVEDYDVFEETSLDSGAADVTEAIPAELTTEGHALGTVVSEVCGLSNVYSKDKYPEARIDAYLFTPCGFSANGVVPASKPAEEDRSALSSTHYFTVHVTPEPHCSYASFETNVPARQTGRETVEVIEQIVNIFKPGRFSVTLFEAKPSDGEQPKKPSKMDQIKGYRRVERIVHDLDGYDLVFRYFERHDWKGGKPRLGECY